MRPNDALQQPASRASVRDPGHGHALRQPVTSRRDDLETPEPERVPAIATAVLVMPSGVRIEGLDIDGIVRLLRSMA